MVKLTAFILARKINVLLPHVVRLAVEWTLLITRLLA